MLTAIQTSVSNRESMLGVDRLDILISEQWEDGSFGSVPGHAAHRHALLFQLA